MAGRQSSSAASHHPCLPLPAHGASASLALLPSRCTQLQVLLHAGDARSWRCTQGCRDPYCTPVSPLAQHHENHTAFPTGSFISACVVIALWGRPCASSLWGRKDLGAASGVCRGCMASLLQCYCGQGAVAGPSSPPRAQLQDSCSSLHPWPRCHQQAGAEQGWGWSAAACA